MVEGRSEIDQSLITGETLHVTAERGTPVYAGTLNVSGALRVQVAAAAEGTLLAEITRLLDNALQARSRYVRLADRASRLYAPVVHATALLTMLGWVLLGASWHDAIVTAIAVLIITCPCALGLAIPAVQTVASRRDVPHGVLINSGDAIERVADVDTVVFDKTGTLTLAGTGRRQRRRHACRDLELAGRLALSSHHPVAARGGAGVGSESRRCGARSRSPGRACARCCDGVELRLGSPSFCGAERLANEILGNDPEVSVVAFSAGAADASASPCGRDCARCAGRHRRAARRAASRSKCCRATASLRCGMRRDALGVAEWRAGVTPADKIARIEELKRPGAR